MRAPSLRLELQPVQEKPAEVRPYWSKVFHQVEVLMKQRQGLGGEVAFWLARDIVDKQLELEAQQ